MDYFSSKGRYPKFFLTFSTHIKPPDSRVPKGISKINPVWPPLKWRFRIDPEKKQCWYREIWQCVTMKMFSGVATFRSARLSVTFVKFRIVWVAAPAQMPEKPHIICHCLGPTAHFLLIFFVCVLFFSLQQDFFARWLGPNLSRSPAVGLEGIVRWYRNERRWVWTLGTKILLFLDMRLD